MLKSDPAKAEEGLREIPPLREAVEEADNYMENSDWANALGEPSARGLGPRKQMFPRSKNVLK